MTTRKSQATKATEQGDTKPQDTTPDTPPGQGAKETTQDSATDPAAKDGTPNAKGDAKSGAKGKRQVLKVSARGVSFRRAGLQFGHEARTLYADELTDDQVAALKAEPRLLVVEAEVEE